MKSFYATTEGGILAGPPGDAVPTDAIGPLLPGCEARSDEGEIVYKGPGAFKGYYGDTPLDGGWVRTGDAGLIENGSLRFIDRKESISGTLAPQAIEAVLRSSPFIRDAWVFTKGALVVVNFPTVARWAGKRKIAFSTLAELAQRPEVYDLIASEIANLPVKAFVILHREFDAEELTQSLTLKRHALEERHSVIVNAIDAGKTSVEVDGTILAIRGVLS